MTGRILLVEAKIDGHYLYYVRLLVLAALDRGDEVVLATRADLTRTKEGRFYLSDLFDRVQLAVAEGIDLPGLESLAADHHATRTVVPDADLWLGPLARRGGWRGPGDLELLVLRSSTQPRRIPGAQAVRTGVKRALMARVAVMRGVRLSVLRSSIWAGRSALQATRDPITSTSTPTSLASFADQWGIGADRTWFAVCGNITDRKNLPLVASAVAAISADRPVGLLIAGQVEAGQLAAAQQSLDIIDRRGRLVVLDRMLDEEELDAAIGVVDCVVLAHSNEGPSGLLAKCAASGTRALTAGARSLRQDARRIPTIAAWTPLDAVHLTAALRRVIGAPRPRPVVPLGTKAFTDSLLGRGPADGLRVMWCSPSYGYGGDLLYFEPIFRGLSRHFPCMSVPVDASFPTARYPGLPLRPVLRFHRLSSPSLYGRGTTLIPTVGTLIRLGRLRPQVLLCIEFTPLSVAGMLLARALPGRRRVLLLLESDPAFRGTPGSPRTLAVKRLLARLADVVVANSDLAEQFAVDRLRVEKERVVRQTYLTSDPSRGADPLDEVDELSVLFVNSLTQRKGPHLLIRAFAALPERVRRSARLDIVGDGEDRHALELLATELGVASRTVFHGRVPYDSLQPFYRTAAVVVAPSLADYRSLGAIEAAAAGRPAIVSSRDGAHAELARSGAFVVDPEQDGALSGALTALLDEPEVRADRAARAVRHRASHSLPVVVDGLASLIATQRPDAETRP